MLRCNRDWREWSARFFRLLLPLPPLSPSSPPRLFTRVTAAEDEEYEEAATFTRARRLREEMLVRAQLSQRQQQQSIRLLETTTMEEGRKELAELEKVLRSRHDAEVNKARMAMDVRNEEACAQRASVQRRACAQPLQSFRAS